MDLPLEKVSKITSASLTNMAVRNNRSELAIANRH